MDHKRYPLYLEVIEHEEYVGIDQTQSEVPAKVLGSEKAFLHLKATNGMKLRVEVPHSTLNDILSLMFPEDFYPEGSSIVTDERGAVISVNQEFSSQGTGGS